MKLSNIIPFVSLILCVSCLKEESPVIEPFHDYGRKNVLLEKGEIVDGKRNGEWIRYYDKGEIKEVKNYLDDRLEGNYEFYYKGGTISSSGKYSNGKKHGEWKYFNERGRVTKEENYLNGLLEGRYVEYKNKENVNLQGEYSKGKKDKIWLDYSKRRPNKRELYYNQDSLLCELHYLTSSLVSEENTFKILRPIYYSDFRPELPYYPAWFNANLDGQLYINGRKVIDFKKGEEIEILIEEREFTYSFRYPRGRSHRLDIQIDSISLSKQCIEYLILEEDSVITKAIYTKTINDLMTYLEGPIESNYNYEWNKKRYEIIKDSLYKSLLDQACRKHLDIKIDEMESFIKDSSASEFNNQWFNEAFYMGSRELDSLILLAYYLKNDVVHIDSTWSQYLTENRDTFPLIHLNEMKCLLKENEDTLMIDGEFCDFETELARLNISYQEKHCTFIALFEGYRINGFEFEIFLNCADSHSSMSTVIRLKDQDGKFNDVLLSNSYVREGYYEGLIANLNLDGDFEIRVGEYEGLKSYDVVLDYELNDQMELVFKGVKKVHYFRHYK